MDKLFPAKSKISLREKPIFSSHILEKTPEYSGVFFRIFVTNIGFCQNQNLKKKLRIFD